MRARRGAQSRVRGRVCSIVAEREISKAFAEQVANLRIHSGCAGYSRVLRERLFLRRSYCRGDRPPRKISARRFAC